MSGPQSRNVRIKKRGAISSAWLEKYKPKLLKDTDHCLDLDSLKENKSESEDTHCDEEMFTTEKTNLEGENTCNTLSTKKQIEISCSIENDKETSWNSFNVEGRNAKKKSPEVKLRPNSPQSVVDESCKRDDKTVVTSKCKEKDEKYPNEELHTKVSDPHKSSRKSCLGDSDFISVSNPIMSNALEDAEPPLIEDSRDSPLEITRNKRKAGRETTELEKPRKKFRCESDVDEEICEESKG